MCFWYISCFFLYMCVFVIALKIHEATVYFYLLFMIKCILFCFSLRHSSRSVYAIVLNGFCFKSDKRLILLTYAALMHLRVCSHLLRRQERKKKRERDSSKPPQCRINCMVIVCIKLAINLFHAHTITSLWWLVHLCTSR